MKAVLMSIKPRWCELIASGKKTVEVRKTKPKLDVPFKVYIYCTNTKPYLVWGDVFRGNWETEFTHLSGYNRADAEKIWDVFNGKVIGEFVCDSIDDFYCASIPYRKENNLGYGYFVDNGVYKVDGWHEGVVFERSGPRIDTMLKNTDLENMCLSAQEIFDYIGIGKHLYAWHISNLVIYDKPRGLRDFIVPSKIGCCNEGKCRGCRYFDRGNGFNIEDDCNAKFSTDEYKPLRRPPQSWFYVEEQSDG